ncbi:uncharacterized protein LOC103488684 isoform X3 [Cucumis melo]|uniref:Uncharacterized protein LOC103488684 isoform X3 n=1 Tax=Cucumis melo TaxID=3656 RepID=A0ABM3KLC3_CUCME|nr:uncharacterized protein LOC103488684 isoform X3 [Cucumis melo]XP_050938568.1 uncharacterized protein LOC103488684 isoform X3 [Cucumis melo]
MLVFFWSCQLLEPLQSPLPNHLFSFGAIPNVRAKGRALVRVADILNHLQRKEPVNSNDMVVPEINTLILMDREVHVELRKWQLGWVLNAIVSLWLVAVLVPIVRVAAFIWWARRNIDQSNLEINFKYSTAVKGFVS